MKTTPEVRVAYARVIDLAEDRGAYSEEVKEALEALDQLDRGAHDAARDELYFRVEVEHSLRR